MISNTDIEAALRAALPIEYHPHTSELAHLLQQALQNGKDSHANQTLAPLLESLGGQTINVSGTTIKFGAGNQFGDVRFGDIAGRDMVKITLVVGDRVEDEEQALRRRTIALVRKIWVSGILERSLHQQALITLGLNYDASAVDYPWQVEVNSASGEVSDLTQPLHNLFAAEGHELLILGEPGGGKTTLLLDLARALLAQAEESTSSPLPLVINLASWAQKRKPLAAWLLDELSERYDVPAVVGRHWLERRQVILLLDGLDEVAAKYQAACVESINTFRAQYGFAGMAVGCRSEEYQTIGRQLRLRAAVRLQLLTLAQIETYLLRLGPALTGLRIAVARDGAVRKLAQTPLLLSMMVIIYKGVDVLDVVGPRGGLNPRKDLFDRFIERAFATTPTGAYPKEKVLRYLAWLALQMCEFSITVINERSLAFAEEEYYFREKPLAGLLKYGLRPPLWNGIAYIIPGGARLRRGLNILTDNEPWDLTALLDQAARLGLIRPIHNGHIFIHRLLLDHLAETAPADLQDPIYKRLYRRFSGDGTGTK